MRDFISRWSEDKDIHFSYSSLVVMWQVTSSMISREEWLDICKMFSLFSLYRTNLRAEISNVPRIEDEYISSERPNEGGRDRRRERERNRAGMTATIKLHPGSDEFELDSIHLELCQWGEKERISTSTELLEGCFVDFDLKSIQSMVSSCRNLIESRNNYNLSLSWDTAA